ncbi:formate C-acetyltransferase [Erysipelothrix aquatica]|uniref:formate C-acetyltransferase n=1 Tax=Erysipelothrix aquatica TaxID=2683714 RepID=UPI00135CBAF4|nr:formate C-acetyltransferase [Erysipelothrix aquatica]
MTKAWNGFKPGSWQEEINVRDFIQQNVTPYEGDDKFLAPISDNTDRLWNKSLELLKEEVKVRVLDIEMNEMSGIDNFGPGYIIKEDEEIVGLQTDAPLKRIINPYGGIRLVDNILDIYGRKLDDQTSHFWHNYTKTHNAGVFDAYTPEIRKYRTTGLLTGLPDAYGRGRIIGDYRRVALYGIDFLIAEKKKDLAKIRKINAEGIQLREEVNEQIRALAEIKSMASKYGFDISQPAVNAKEAIQWTYFAYLAAIKENNGAAMSLGRTSSFLDIYIERDIAAGEITEMEAQAYIDQFIMKLRLARHLRTPEYDDLFAGDPTWVTESIGGMGQDGRTLVTKNSFRYLHTLTNLGPAPEPNMTVLWSEDLPIGFKRYCAKMSIETGAIQYENDDIMRPNFGDDYGIACCVSAMEIGKQMQYFGARTNLAKALLYSMNGGRDEVKGIKVIDNVPEMKDEILDYDKVMAVYDDVLKEVAAVYVDTMNIIHYMHDKYAYEKGQMALHDTNVERLMAFGIAGLSVAVDSLSAIKYASVKPIRNEEGIAVDFEVEGDYPKYGNDDDAVDAIAVDLVERFSGYLKEHELIRNAKHTLSILTITSNVVYGKKTGSTPDGRQAGEPFAPGANPMHGRDSSGALASLNSVAKIPYADVCEDGVSNTFSIVPQVLGKSEDERVNNLVGVMNGYFNQKAHHLNVNVLNRELLEDAMQNPEKYPQLTIRVSGYAVNFNRLSTEQQREVISRTFHETI